MQIEDVPGRLAATSGRGPGSDAERRAAAWLRDGLRADGEVASLRTVWVRPDWPLAHGLHVALAVTGSAVSVSYPAIGLGLLALAALSLGGDLTGAFFLLRRLTPSRATQNVLVSAPSLRDTPGDGRLRLLLTANIDAGRTGAAYRDGWVRAEAAVRRRLGGRVPSVSGLLALTVVLLAGLAAARLAGASGTALGVVQLVPTVVLLIALAVLVDIALSAPSPGANANASGVAAAIAVLAALRRSPPAHLDVELILAGAGEQSALGLRAALAERRSGGWRSEDAAVLAIEPCGTGSVRFLTHDGPLMALRLHPQMIMCARAAAAADPLLGARPHRGHGAGAAYAARRLRWPAIAVGALDQHDRAGRAHQAEDVAAGVEQRAIGDAVELCLGIVDQLDAGMGAAGAARRRGQGARRAATDGPGPRRSPA
jgi:hypothetical protein